MELQNIYDLKGIDPNHIKSRDRIVLKCCSCKALKEMQWSDAKRKTSYVCIKCAQKKRQSAHRSQHSIPNNSDKILVTCYRCGCERPITWGCVKRLPPKALCPSCSNINRFIKQRELTGKAKAFDKVTTKCSKCGSEKEVYQHNINTLNKKRRVYQCFPCSGNGVSYGEVEIFTFLTEGLGISNIIKSDRTILDGKEIDIYLPEYKIGIEYNGNYWHSQKNNPEKKYHYNKRVLAQSKGVKLIQIRSDEWESKRPIVESIISSLLGKNKKYYARALKVKKVSKIEAQEFLEDNHLMGSIIATKNIGLYHETKGLLQLFCYKVDYRGTLDCSRICALRGITVVGGVSRLLKAAILSSPGITKIQSFVDLRYADGHSLLSMGFDRIGVTLGWGWTDGRKVYNRLQCRANMDERKLTQAQHARELGWHKLYDAGQAKFEKPPIKSKK